jgi:hypothetical protein
MLPWNDGPGPCLTYRYGALHSVILSPLQWAKVAD